LQRQPLAIRELRRSLQRRPLAIQERRRSRSGRRLEWECLGEARDDGAHERTRSAVRYAVAPCPRGPWSTRCERLAARCCVVALGRTNGLDGVAATQRRRGPRSFSLRRRNRKTGRTSFEGAGALSKR